MTENRPGIERASWVAGIVSAMLAAIGLFYALQPIEQESVPTSVIQNASSVGTQIGLISGNVTVINQATQSPITSSIQATTGAFTASIPLPPSAKAIFGPVSGELKHNDEGEVVWFKAEQSLANLAVEATFVNPYASADHPWIAVIFFRRDSRLGIISSNEWNSGNYNESGWKRQNDGVLKPGLLATAKEGKNHVRLIASGVLGCLYVNGVFVADLDLSGQLTSGDVAVGISENEYTLSGAATKFEDFTVYEIAQVDICPK
jgi:hypothetical protein